MPDPTQNLYKGNHQKSPTIPIKWRVHTETRANPPLLRRSNRRRGVTYEMNREGSQMLDAADQECLNLNRKKTPRLDR
jgi:hypothetical protein